MSWKWVSTRTYLMIQFKKIKSKPLHSGIYDKIVDSFFYTSLCYVVTSGKVLSHIFHAIIPLSHIISYHIIVRIWKFLPNYFFLYPKFFNLLIDKFFIKVKKNLNSHLYFISFKISLLLPHIIQNPWYLKSNVFRSS